MPNARLSTRRVRWTRLAAFVFGVMSPAPAPAQLAVDRVEIFLEPQRAGQRVASFRVSNEGDRVVEATIYVEDWERRDDGEHSFAPSGTLPHSCGQFLRLFPLSLRLPPGGSQAVRVALEDADTLRAACWSIVFVESAPAAPRGGRQITYVTRLGVKVYMLPQGLVRDGDVEDLQVRPRTLRADGSPGEAGAREFVVAFRNSGGLPLWPRGSVEIRRLDNTVAATVDVPEFPVLPGALRAVVVDVPRLPAGHYVALALIDFAGEEIAAGQLELEVP